MSVNASYHHGARLPAVVEPPAAPTDVAAWCTANRRVLDDELTVAGALLFRGFAVPSGREFEATAAALFGGLYGDYGDLPKHAAGERIYHSTPYPPDRMILFHNESSHLPAWPMRIAFYCITPPASGGCTPLVDTRELLRRIDPDVVAEVREKGLLYVRNFVAGVEPSWESFFRTRDRAEVEGRCRTAGIEIAWRPDGGLRLRQRAAGVTRHPVSGEDVFFNQVQLHHVACLDEETRDGLRALFDEDDLPRNVLFGDESPIPDEVVAHLVAVCEAACVRIPWQRGDIIALDNMLVAHARDSYEGEREIAVAMGRLTAQPAAV